MNRAEFLFAAAAMPVALRRPRGAVALITDDTESRIAVVDLEHGLVRSHIATKPSPRSIELVGETAVVAHSVLGAWTLIDTRTLQVRHVLEGFGEPRYTAGAADGRHAFVTDSGHADLYAIDVVRGAVVGRVHLGQWPRHLSLTPDGRTAWVGLGTDSREIAVVDVTDPSHPFLRGKVRPPLLMHDVAIAPSGRAWVTAGTGDEVAVLDERTGRVLHRLPSDPGPQHVSFLGDRAFVTSGDAGTLRVYDEASLRLLHVTEVPVGSYNVQFAGRSVLTPSIHTGTLCVVGRDGTLKRRVQVAASSHDACLARS